MGPRWLRSGLGFPPKRAESITEVGIPDKPPTTLIFCASHWPCRPAPHGIFADFRFDFVGVHTGTKIPRLVIIADMLETEPKIVVETFARFRRAMLGWEPTIGMVALPKARCPETYRRFIFIRTASHIRNMTRGPRRGKQGRHANARLASGISNVPLGGFRPVFVELRPERFHNIAIG